MGMALAGTRDVPHKILIVDDEASILFAMREYFTPRGYHVECARGVAEAEARLGSGPYAVLIADLRLTGGDHAEGFEIVDRVRARHPTTRVIMLTAYGSSAIEQEARRRGVDVFLEKPQLLPKVERIVAELLRSPGDTERSERPM
jgi:DNA-binding NtrC family response regulator